MKTLKEVLEGIEAFVKDMEDLGVDVELAIAGDPMVLELKPGITLLAVLKMNIGEDLEVELGNPQRRIGRWFKPLEEDLEASG